MSKTRVAALLVLPLLALAFGAAPAQSPLPQNPTPTQSPAPTPAPLPPGPIDPEVIAALLKKYEVPGVSIAVIKDFKIDWAQGYGISDVETDARVGVETMFQAASISKPAAAMASVRAVQEATV